jgi:hypothetical protein
MYTITLKSDDDLPMKEDQELVISEREPRSMPSGFMASGLTTPPMSMQQTHIVEESDLGRAIAELNDDKTDSVSKMSNIDMRSRLGSLEISGLLSADMLVSMQFLPAPLLNLTRQKKRLAVSKGGLGRREIVEIVVGEREHQKPAGGMFPSLMKK